MSTAETIFYSLALVAGGYLLGGGAGTLLNSVPPIAAQEPGAAAPAVPSCHSGGGGCGCGRAAAQQ